MTKTIIATKLEMVFKMSKMPCLPRMYSLSKTHLQVRVLEEPGIVEKFLNLRTDVCWQILFLSFLFFLRKNNLKSLYNPIFLL